jgi:transposase
LDTLQTNIATLSAAVCVDSQKYWRWYHDSLSGFQDTEYQSIQYQHDVQISQYGRNEDVRVPILKPENFGKNMAVDEKQIGEEMHTIVSNRDNGKIALMAQTVSSAPLEKIMEQYPVEARKVETITRDMSATYAKFSNKSFANASQIIDKFHIIRDLMECSQAVRIRYRQEILREQRLFKQAQKQSKKEDVQVEKFEEEKLENGETALECLARSRYLLFKYQDDWTARQTHRAMALFKKYPDIEKAYHLSCEFRKWMRKENVGVSNQILQNQLNKWYKNVEDAGIDELLNFKYTVKRNQLEIMNYFIFGATNAIAENINSKIQRFIMINQGTRHREFFYFRMAKYFS